MTIRDARGEPVSAASTASLAAFEAALAQFNTYMDDPVATIDTALAEQPDFVMGHVLKAELMISAWERSMSGAIRSTCDSLATLRDKANARERGHIAAIAAWADGDWAGYKRQLDLVCMEHPRDLLALQAGHLSDFYHGDRENLRGRVARALPSWSADLPGYSYVLGMLAFGLEEAGDYGRAEETGRHALALQPDDGWAQHAVAHVLEMQARQPEAIAFMEAGAGRWGRPGNAFAFHNWWHTALYNLDQGRIDRALEIYDTCIRPAPSEMQLELVDAVAFLWRLHLRGIDVGDRWTGIAEIYARTGEEGFYVFNDMHAMMAYAATGRHGDADRLLAEVERQALARGTNGDMARAVGLPVIAAVHAFGRGDFAGATDLLLPIRTRTYPFGGSHAQRDIVQRTLIEAAHRAGRTALATGLLQERVFLKPACPFSWNWLERVRGGNDSAVRAVA
ncbi:tetratricopeptide repeat protein [Thalassobaculum sp.]|uniref:tetratricopeptide repeat protein n=1 Tax=Thalassobaculum sp. TaxID=2022740 RepID=UPI0032EBDA5D